MCSYPFNSVFSTTSLRSEPKYILYICISKPKIQIWVNFGGPSNGRCWYIIRLFGLFLGYLVCFGPFGTFMVIWYIFPVLVSCAKNNLATLPSVPAAKAADPWTSWDSPESTRTSGGRRCSATRMTQHFLAAAKQRPKIGSRFSASLAIFRRKNWRFY
jgi:hypothetical protein